METARFVTERISMNTEHGYWQCFAANGKTRRYTRDRVRVPLRVTSTGSAQVLQGLSNDLSEAGMGFYLSKRFEIGQRVRIEMRPPGSHDEVSIEAIVRNCDGFRCGVEFQMSLPNYREVADRGAPVSST